MLACIVLAGTVGAQQPAPIVSPDVSADGRVTFRILAPGAREVSVIGIRHLPAQPMVKDEKGLWSVTVGPLEPDVYSYTLSVDGAVVTDPHDRDIKKYFS
jgi:1,4-alpha-glucan branching enzyme